MNNLKNNFYSKFSMGLVVVVMILLTTGCQKAKLLSELNPNPTSTPIPTPTPNPLCPATYVFVPGNATYGTNDFCVMRFEAKDVGGIATSQAASNPWVSVNRTVAKAACTALGANYDLISNSESMTIATNIEQQATNWSSEVVGTGHLNRGWSAFAADDGFQNTGVAPSTSTACLYNTAANACASNGSHKFKRTHTLSTQEEIWDFSGNVWEWIEGGNFGPTNGCSTAAWAEIPNFGCGTALDYMPSNPAGVTAANYNSSYGLGQIFGGPKTGALRGGGWLDGINAGAFAVYTRLLTTGFGVNIGFRCVYRP